MDARFNETGNGGDLALTANDIAVVYGVENMPYLSMFSGAGYWANDLLLSEGISWAFQCVTEAALLNTALTSSGRIAIENAVKTDLQRLLQDVPGTELSVAVTIESDDKLNINIIFNGQEFNYLWNPVQLSLIDASLPLICPLPTGLVIYDITDTSVSATWDGPGTFRWAIWLGTPIYGETGVFTSASVSTLTPDTNYQFYLYRRCGSEDDPYDSEPIIIPFTTLP